jgi:xylulokinase
MTLEYIASFDIGTTQAKGILVSKDARPILERNVDLVTNSLNNRMEQDPQQWYQAVQSIVREWYQAGVQPSEIKLLTFSGQMQDCIPVDHNGFPLRPAILYGDSRAEKEAEVLQAQFPIQAITGNHMDGTIVFPKLLWMREHEKERYKRADAFLLSSKDYVIRQLTGVSVTDPTTAATSGMMNIQSLQWQEDWLEVAGIDIAMLPTICAADQIVGYVSKQAAEQTGLLAGIPVLCGIGDGGSASIGAGVFHSGDIYGYIGTTGWVATPAAKVSVVTKGVFHLPYIGGNKFLAIAPLMNAGNVHRWAVATFANIVDDYDTLEQMITDSDRLTNDLLFLPYLHGERFPVQDPAASGSFIGIRSYTTRADLSCAALEGVAMAIKQVVESLSPHSGGSLSLIGGGSQSRVWMQIIADVLQKQVIVPNESKFFPAMGAAVLGGKALGWETEVSDFTQRIHTIFPTATFVPNIDLAEHYAQKYEKFKRLYPALQHIF